MTIKNRIREFEEKAANCRLQKLRSFLLPAGTLNTTNTIVQMQEEYIERLPAALELFFNKYGELVELEFSGEEKKTGNGGKLYLQFITSSGIINYFPNARYGRFIAYNK